MHGSSREPLFLPIPIASVSSIHRNKYGTVPLQGDLFYDRRPGSDPFPVEGAKLADVIANVSFVTHAVIGLDQEGERLKSPGFFRRIAIESPLQMSDSARIVLLQEIHLAELVVEGRGIAVDLQSSSQGIAGEPQQALPQGGTRKLVVGLHIATVPFDSPLQQAGGLCILSPFV